MKDNEHHKHIAGRNSQSLLFADSVPTNSYTHRNLFVTPKSICAVLSQSFVDMCRMGESLIHSVCTFPLRSNTVIFCFLFQLLYCNEVSFLPYI